MNKVQMNLSDYLFMQFKTRTPTLEQVAAMYYPHLSKAKILEKARKKEFPFICYKIDESQKSPYLVDIFDLAFVLDKRYNEQAKEYEIFTKSALTNSQN
ncbi:MAG: pyocin activator PrtN family protein [Chryseobacterium sp.]|nr:pyocin activator PrtN family protein [Chryseobacterium sp.]